MPLFNLVVIEQTISRIVAANPNPTNSATQQRELTKQINDAITAQVQPVLNTITSLQAALADEHNVEQALVDRVTAVETALTDTVNHLAAGNVDAATEVASAVLPDATAAKVETTGNGTNVTETDPNAKPGEAASTAGTGEGDGAGAGVDATKDAQ